MTTQPNQVEAPELLACPACKVDHAKDQDLCDIALKAEEFGASVAWANEPDDFHHLIQFTPDKLRDWSRTPDARIAGLVSALEEAADDLALSADYFERRKEAGAGVIRQKERKLRKLLATFRETDRG